MNAIKTIKIEEARDTPTVFKMIEGRFKSTKSSLDLTNLNDLYGSEFFDKSYGRLKPKLYVSYEREYLSEIDCFVERECATVRFRSTIESSLPFNKELTHENKDDHFLDIPRNRSWMKYYPKKVRKLFSFDSK